MTEPKNIGNPFPGLRPFETDEYGLFFGREGQSDALIERLQRSHFLAVVGTSGSGKSSLVRAGLLPALRGGMMAGAGSGWRIAIMRPGSDPIGNLAAALAEKGVLLEAGGGLPAAEAQAVIEATLRRGSLGLVDATRQARLEQQKLLIVVDQFEELFRFRAARTSNTGDDASAFVKLLLEAAQQSELPIYVVPTMRSDFLGDCAQFQGLPEAINDGQYLIPRMTRDERRVAITGPVGVTRGKITEPLVNRLMNDVGDNPDQLPILQHALMRTWDFWSAHHRNSEPIGLEHYEAVGTMSDALSNHADEAFNELPSERSRKIAESLFKTLTERGADNREIRRPTSLKDICAIAEASGTEVVAVIDVFRGGGRSFLMPPAGLPLRADTVVDISHESLIRNWLRLKDWVNEEAQSARIYRRLAEASVLHREGSEGLLQDPALQIALDWREKTKPTAAGASRYHPEFEEALRYLDESRTARDAAAAERERQRDEQIARERRELEQAQVYAEQQRRAARRLRYLSIGMAIMFVLALATAAFAMKTWRTAASARDSAARARDAETAARIESEKSLEILRVTQAELIRKTGITEASVADTKKANAAAVIARDKAETEAKRANAQAAIAAKNLDVATKAVEKTEKSRQANENFRDAVVLAQRGSYQDADKMLTAAIQGYQSKIVSNHEAEADASVERGHMTYTRGYRTFVATGGRFEVPRVSGDGLFDNGVRARADVDDTIKHYDDAARVYAEVGSPQKAAASLFSLGTMLMRFAGEVPSVRGMNRGDFADLLVVKSAESELPDFSVFVRAVPFSREDPALKLNEQLKVKYRSMAVERFERALDFYQQAYDKMTPSQRSNNFALSAGRINSAFQVAEVSLQEANELAASHGPADEIDPRRRKAIAYFEKMLGFYGTSGAENYAYLLVWLSGLYMDLDDYSSANKYLDKALLAYTTNKDVGYNTASALSSMAKVAEQEEQWRSASFLHFKALTAHQEAGDILGQATAEYGLGWVNESGIGTATFENAIGHYRRAIALYKQAHDKDPGLTKDLLHIGEVARGINDYDLTIEAYTLAAAFASESGRGDHQREEAIALAEIGAVRVAMNQPQPALESYKRALEIYQKLAAAEFDFEGTREDAEEEVERIGRIVKALSEGEWKAGSRR